MGPINPLTDDLSDRDLAAGEMPMSLTDPGVPSWLDTEGTSYERWYDCDSSPVPTLQRVWLAELRQHLPADTPVVTKAQRAEELRLQCRPAGAGGGGNDQ